MKRFLKYFTVFLASFIILISAVTLSVLNWPNLILNKIVVARLINIAGNFGFDIRYDDIRITAKNMGFLNSRVRIVFENLSLKSPPKVEKAAFGKIDICFRYGFLGFKPALLEVGPIEITRGIVDVADGNKDLIAEKKNEPLSLEIPEIKLPAFLRKTRFKSINVDIESFSYSEAGNVTGGSLKIFTPKDSAWLETVNFDVSLNTSAMSISTNGNVKSASGFLNEDMIIDTAFNVYGSAGWDCNGNLSAKHHSKKIEYATDLKFKTNDLSGSTDIKGIFSDDKILADLNLNILNPSSIVNKAEASSCKISLKKKKTGKNDGNLDVQCAVKLFVKSIKTTPEIVKIFGTPDVIELSFKSKLDTFYMFDPNHKTKGSVELFLSTMKNRLADTSGHVKFSLNGNFSNPPDSLNVSADMDVDFKIAEFQKVVEALKHTTYAVWAPFNVLEGEVVFSLEGKVPSIKSSGTFPAVFETRLRSKDEKLFLNTKGETKIQFSGPVVREIALDMNVELTDIEITLPNLQFASLPRISPDARIKTEHKRKERKKALIDYDVYVHTPKETPVKIKSNLTKAPIPINIDAHAKNDHLSGKIKIDDFKVGLFSKEAHIKTFELELQDPVKHSEVSGEIQLKASDYRISIMIGGSIDSPIMWFESAPPLSEENIIAVMLYGEPLDELDEDNASSVGNMKSAIANKAVALTTFFLMGVTPFQSIYYNPNTGAFTARIKITDKTSLSVGKRDKDTQEIGLRQMIGKGWLVNTSVSQDKQTSTTSGSAYVEWHKRY